jgi:hypothetical protein
MQIYQRQGDKNIIIIMVIISIIIIITRVGTSQRLYLGILPTILDDSDTEIHSATSLIDLA